LTQLAFGFLQPGVVFMSLADVARGEQGKRLGFDVQSRHSHIDGDPDAFLARAEKIILLRVKHLALGAGLTKALFPAGVAEADPVSRGFGKQFLSRHAGEAFGRGVDVEQLFRVRVEEEQGVP